MLVYIPFIYFTTWLFLHLRASGTRFGAGAMSILWIDLSAFFSILLDVRDLYGDFGCNPYAISLNGVIIYCLCWTVALYPLTRLDKTAFEDITITKPKLFTALCYVFIISMILHIVFNDVMDKIITGFSMDSSEAYGETLNSDTYQGGAGNYIMWIPNIIATFGPLYLMLWFISISICRQNIFIRVCLLLSSMMAMTLGFALGGRAQLIWWVITFMVYLCLFKPVLNKQHIRNIYMILAIVGSLIVVAFMAITLSRFDDGGDYALESFIGYAGQQLNNFCTILPYAKLGTTTPNHIIPLYSYVIERIPFRLQDYHANLANTFPYQVNVFFTFFGDLIHDIGLLGLFVFMVLYTICCNKIITNKNGTSLHCAQLFLLPVLFRFPVEGLFSWPFVRYNHSLFILFSVALFITFKYTLKYGSRKI